MINITLKIELPEYVNPTHVDLTPDSAVAIAADYDCLNELECFVIDLRTSILAHKVNKNTIAIKQSELF